MHIIRQLPIVDAEMIVRIRIRKTEDHCFRLHECCVPEINYTWDIGPMSRENGHDDRT